MKSKKQAPASRRTKLPRNYDYSNKFLTDWKRLQNSGRRDMAALKKAMLLLLANDGPLPSEYKDHQLSGNLGKYRECHIGGDFLLLYELRDDREVIFVRAGSHADLFE